MGRGWGQETRKGWWEGARDKMGGGQVQNLHSPCTSEKLAASYKMLLYLYVCTPYTSLLPYIRILSLRATLYCNKGCKLDEQVPLKLFATPFCSGSVRSTPPQAHTSESQLDAEGKDDLRHQELLVLLERLVSHQITNVVPAGQERKQHHD